MALDSGQVYAAGFVRDEDGRLVLIEGADTGVMTNGLLRDPDGRVVVATEAA